MKILNRSDFLRLPAGTIYAKYSSLGCWGDLCVKEESTQYNDWYQYSLLNGWGGCTNSDEFFTAVTNCESGNAHLRNEFDSCGRDGLFEDDQLFVVYDEIDVLQLIHHLKKIVGLPDLSEHKQENSFTDGLS